MAKILPFLLQICYTSQRCDSNPWHFLPLAKHITSGSAAKGETNEYKKMDALISAAEQRRGRTLREVARYRKQIALQLRQTSDGLIEEPANSFSEAA